MSGSNGMGQKIMPLSSFWSLQALKAGTTSLGMLTTMDGIYLADTGVDFMNGDVDKAVVELTCVWQVDGVRLADGWYVIGR